MSLIEVKDLKVHFPIQEGFFSKTKQFVKAVDGVSFKIEKGSTVGLVGESGSGKSTIGKTIVRLNVPTAGDIHYQGQSIMSLGESEFFPYRKKIQMIFQDPYNSLNPRMTVSGIISEPLDIHFPDMSPSVKDDKIAELLVKVGLQADHRNRYPHQFSGGQRQRIGIARALSVEPDFIICDEAVSALDVSVQAQIINLLQDVQEEYDLTYLFIAHDLAVVEHISDFVLVMSQGEIVEQATADEIYANPQDPYTQKLLNAIPKMPTINAVGLG
ncbi:ATP-binding cassette domain-containing protein [Opitutia bacterium ISCC 51]|nr:ATP-binding cassette domain-containing protein [Opitutae bacterium ISCC 51]QXD29502.1 ATP-binding cassette domain-containing protein [Opitutae bacterium ISCC 52]